MRSRFSDALRLGLLATASLAAMTAPAFAAPIVAVVATVGAFLTGGTFLAAAANAGIGLALNFGLSLLSGAISGKPKSLGGSSNSIQIGAEAPRQVIFGRGLTAGRLVYVKGVGKKNTTIHAVYAICDWECDSIEKVWVGGIERALTSVSVVGTEHVRYTVNGLNSKIVLKFFRGTAAQTADTELITASGDATGTTLGAWTSAHDGVGVCYVSAIFTYDEDDLPSLPQLQFQIKGAKLYDWRLDSTNGGSGSHRWTDPTTWAWSGNPAVCDYNFRRGFFRGAQRILGMGVPSSDLLHNLYTAAANICDESVTEGGGSESRYTCGVIVNDDAEFRVAIDAFRLAMAGDVLDRAGQFGVIAGAAYVPVMTLTDADMKADAPGSFARKGSRSDLYNAVTISYLNPVLTWDQDSLTPITDAGWEAEDGDERLVKDVALPMVYKPYQARRIGKILHNQSRRQATHTGTYPAAFSALEPGDWVIKEFERDGFDTLTMKVTRVQEVAPEWYEISLIEVHEDDFDQPAGTIPATTTPVIVAHQKGPGTPGTPSLVEVVTVNPDGTVVSTVRVSFTAGATAVSYSVGVQEGAADEVERTVNNLRYSFKAVIGTLYTVRVRAIDSDGRSGTWTSTATITPSGDTTIPGPVTSLTVTPTVYGFAISWTNPAATNDLASINIYESATSTFASATLIASVPAAAQLWFRENLPVNTLRYYWVKASDRTGNLSTQYPSGNPGTSGTTLDIDGAVDLRYGSVLASKMLITGNDNLVRDPDYADAGYWLSTGTGFTISTDATPLAAMNAVRMAKSATGNGTTSQSNSNYQIKSTNKIAVTPGSRYLWKFPQYVTSGFTGRGVYTVFWYKADGTASSTASTGATGTDYRTVAAPVAVQSTYDSGVDSVTVLTAPADAVAATLRYAIQWSTTLNNAGNCYFGRPLFRELNTGSLTVDGTITSSKINVANLAAINANMGAIVAGSVTSPNFATDANGVPTAGFKLDTATDLVQGKGGTFADIVGYGADFSRRPIKSTAPLIVNNILSDGAGAPSELSRGVGFASSSWSMVGLPSFTRTPYMFRMDAGFESGSDNMSTFNRGYPMTDGELLPERVTAYMDGNENMIVFKDDGSIVFEDYNGSGGLIASYSIESTFSGMKWIFDIEKDVLNSAGLSTVVGGLGMMRRHFPWVVPAGTTKLSFKCWGAGGGHNLNSSSYWGGPGGYSYGQFNVGNSYGIRVGDVLWFVIGEGGQKYQPNHLLGWGGRGQANSARWGGGGLTGVFLHSISRSNSLVIAGGGGGGHDGGTGSPGNCTTIDTGGVNTWSGGKTGSTIRRLHGIDWEYASSKAQGAGGGGYDGGTHLLAAPNGNTSQDCGGRGGKGYVNTGLSGYVAGSQVISFTSVNTHGDATSRNPPNNATANYTDNQQCWRTRAKVGVGACSADIAGDESAGNGLAVILIN